MCQDLLGGSFLPITFAAIIYPCVDSLLSRFKLSDHDASHVRVAVCGWDLCIFLHVLAMP